jgi:hypothetical protein
MNLHCEQMDLWQTPTYITYMCISNNNGGWKGIKHRYSLWVKHHSNGVWEDAEDHNYMLERIKDHLDKLNSFKKLDFFIM